MQLQKFALLSLLVLVAPLFASAQEFPAFPMSFWGNVTLNGSPAPVGTVVNAYYGDTLAGTVTVQEAGVYGYTEPTKQKLVLAAGSSTITFNVQSAGFNGGAETAGTAALTQPAFVAGGTIQKDLAFTIDVPATPVPTPPAPVSSGGGGGGGGGAPIGLISIPVATTSTSTITSTIQLPTLPQGQVLGAATFHFSRTLSKGMSGNDVTELQKILIAKAFLIIDAPTDFFGNLTVAAVKLYQKDNGLEQVGFVGPKTRALLNGETSTNPDPAKAALIQTLLTTLQTLLDKIAALKAQQATTTVATTTIH